MKERGGNPSWLLVTALLLAVGLTPHSAQADATVTDHHLSCNLFGASGTSNSPYVTLYAQNSSTHAFTFTVVGVVAGSFTGTLTLPPSVEGAEVNLEVWGSLNNYTTFGDTGYYDGGTFFEASEFVAGCAAPTLGHGALAVLLVGLTLAGRAAIRRSAV